MKTELWIKDLGPIEKGLGKHSAPSHAGIQEAMMICNPEYGFHYILTTMSLLFQILRFQIEQCICIVYKPPNQRDFVKATQIN